MSIISAIFWFFEMFLLQTECSVYVSLVIFRHILYDFEIMCKAKCVLGKWQAGELTSKLFRQICAVVLCFRLRRMSRLCLSAMSPNNITLKSWL